MTAQKFTFRFSDKKIEHNLKEAYRIYPEDVNYENAYKRFVDSTRISMRLTQAQQAENIIDMLRAGYIIESAEDHE